MNIKYSKLYFLMWFDTGSVLSKKVPVSSYLVMIRKPSIMYFLFLHQYYLFKKSKKSFGCINIFHSAQMFMKHQNIVVLRET